MEKSCYVIGHREADERLLPVLTEAIQQLISKENVRYFYVGGYGGIDRIAGLAVKEVKKQNANITLHLVLPDHPVERAVEAPDGYDGTYYPEGLENVPRQYAIVRVNRVICKRSRTIKCVTAYILFCNSKDQQGWLHF